MPGGLHRTLRCVTALLAAATLGVLGARAAELPGDLQLIQTVTPAGAASAAIPIPILPGAGSLEPRLVLSYSSQAGNSGVGLGWALAGYPTIVRGSKTREVDGAPGPIAFDAADAFYLDGDRLVPVARLTGATAPAWLGAANGAIQYRRRIDDGTLAFARLTPQGEIASFAVETKSGLRTDLSLAVPGSPALPAPAAYLPTKTSDTAGNYILWRFTLSGLAYRLARVEYTGLEGAAPQAPFAAIDLTYTAARPITTFLLGQPLVRAERLASITTTLINQGGAPAQGISLTLGYDETDKADAYYLTSTRLSAFGDQIAPVSFRYKQSNDPWMKIQKLDLPALGGEVAGERAYKLGDTWAVNGTGKAQGLFMARFSNGQFQAKTYVLGISGWEEASARRAPPVPFVDNQGASTNVLAIDLDDDGFTDLVQSGADGRGEAWVQARGASRAADGWVRDPNHDDPGVPFVESAADGAAPRRLQAVQLQTGRPDILVRTALGEHIALLNNGAAGWARSTTLDFTVPAATEVVFGDFDCDGFDDRAHIVTVRGQKVLQVYGGTRTGWTLKSDTAWAWETAAQNQVTLRAVTIDRTACRSLLLSVRDGAAAETLTVLAGTSSGWAPLKASAPGSMLATSTGAALHPALTDLNGDKYDDVILSEAVGTAAVEEAWLQRPRTTAADPVEWTKSAGLTPPPVRIADAQGAFPDTFVLGLPSGSAAIIAVPSKRYAKGRAWTTTGNVWVAATELAPATPLAVGKNSGEFYRFVDLDNDGLQDLIFNDGKTRGAQRNTGGGWVAASGWEPPRSLAESDDVASRATLIDVNADGLMDLVYAYHDKTGDVRETYLNSGSGWRAAVDGAAWVAPKVMADVSRGDLGWRFADVNGDGRVDLVQAKVDGSFVRSGTAYLNNGSGWTLAPDYEPTVAFVFDQGDGRTLDLGTQLIDVDGDRLPDLVAAYRNPLQPRDRVKGVYKNSNGRFAAASSADVPVMLDAPYYDKASVSFLDLSGDGNLDIVQFTETAGEVYLGNGRNWNAASTTWKLPAEARSATVAFGGTRFLDVNGDGRLDILYIRTGERGVIINTANGWKAVPATSPLQPPDLPFLSDAGDDLGVRLVDVTGHGALDLIKSAANDQRDAWKNPGARQGMVAAITESSGVETLYDYVRLVDTNPATGKPAFARSAAAGAFPNIPLVPFSPVVGLSTTREGGGRNLTRTYAYQDFQFDLLNSRALGFVEIATTEHASDGAYDRVERTEFHPTGDLAGRPKVLQTLIVEGFAPVGVEQTEKTWSLVRTAGLPRPGGGAFEFLQIRLDRNDEAKRDVKGQPLGRLVSEFTYDGWLNARKTTVSRPGRASQTTTAAFVDPTGRADFARYGRVSAVTTEVRDATGLVVSTRKGAFGYAAGTLLPETESLDFGDAELGVTTTYARNARGDVTTVTKQAAAGLRAARRPRPVAATVTGAATRVTRVVYDASGRLVRQRINAKNQTTELTYDASSIGLALASPTRETDPNGLAAVKGYDALGRPASIESADKVLRTVEFKRAADLPAEWLTALSALKQNPYAQRRAKAKDPRKAAVWLAPEVGSAEVRRARGANNKWRLERVTLLDRRGRALRVITPRTDGSATRLAFQDQRYDVRGRLLGETLPYFSGTTPQWTAYEYDALDRRTREERPDGAYAAVDYKGLVQTRTNARGQVTVVTYTPELKPERVVRADGGAVRFAYDAFARVTKVTTPGGRESTYGYDGAGNRNLSTDPNGGKSEFRYDGFGQLREERRGARPWTEFDYDPLGRRVRLARGDQETVWTYDQAGAVGRPWKVELNRQGPAAFTYAETYSYDSVSRLARTTTEIDARGTVDPTFDTRFRGVFAFSYGPFSELVAATYPQSGTSSLIVGREYDADTGQLRRVVDARTAARPALWTLETADAAGRAGRVLLGNGAREVRRYAETTGRLEAMEVSSSSNKSLLSAVYAYDLMGNLLSRRTVGGAAESFGYDVQNRLTTAQRGSVKTEVRYDSDDRITWKTGIGRYHYASDPDAARFHCKAGLGPSALCATDRNGVVTRLFDYDGFGNMTSRVDPSADNEGVTVEYDDDGRASRIVELAEGQPVNGSAAEFYYGPTGQRALTRQIHPGSRSKETIHLGLYERITLKRAGASGSRLSTDRAYVLADGGAFLAVDLIDRRYASPVDAKGPTEQELYQHRDHLGSVVLLTRRDGKVGAEVRYDPWGKASGDLDPTNNSDSGLGVEAAWTRGFTGQDHIPRFDLIHMTGRVYDPELGVFLSVDPVVSDPLSGGDLNPYLYAHGNPLAVTDPSGLWGISDIGDAISNIGHAIGDAAHSVGQTIGGLWEDAKKWVGDNWREIVTVAVIVVVTVVTGGAGAGPVVVAMTAGAAGGMTQSALYGGSVQDVLVAGFVGGVIGGVSGGIGASGLSWGAKAVAQGFVSGVHAEFTGGSFERGFVIGALSRVQPADLVGTSQSGWSVAGRIANKAILNGTISYMQTGKVSGFSIAIGALLQANDEGEAGQWRARTFILSLNPFDEAGPNEFGFTDYIIVGGMVLDRVDDNGVRYFANIGEDNSFLEKAQRRYNAMMGYGGAAQPARTPRRRRGGRLPVPARRGGTRRRAQAAAQVAA